MKPSSHVQTKFDYVTFNGAAEVLYLGQAAQSVADIDNMWTIKKFFYLIASDSTTQIDRVEVLEYVAWADRASLPW